MSPHERKNQPSIKMVRGKRGRLVPNRLVPGEPVDPAKPVDVEKLLEEIRKTKRNGKRAFIDKNYS